MESGPTVIVKKGGFFASIARGVFGLLMTLVICATGLGVYALHIVDARIDNAILIADSLARQARHWREVAPPLLSEALNDRRGEHYDEHVTIAAELDEAAVRRGSGRVSFRITNAGPETISLLALNVVLKDEDGRPIDDFRVFAATPLPLAEGNWRGPLRAGHTREFACWARGVRDSAEVSTEIAELRVLAEAGQLPSPARDETAQASAVEPSLASQ